MVSGFEARPAEELAPVLAWLRRGEAVRARTAFPAGTALPDGRLDLCKQDLGPLGAAAVADALPEGGGPVKHLLLGTDGLGDGGAAAVAPKAVAARVETLYLGCNNIGGGGVCEIANQLIAAPGVVKALWLKRNPVGADGVRAVAETVRAGTVLRTIDLTQTGLAAPDVAVLVDAMIAAGGGARAIERLYIGGNRLGADGARELARLLAAGAVAELYVSAARLGDPGAQVLAAALRSAPPGALRRLSVASNGIGPAALAELVAAAAAAGVELVDAGRVKAAAILAADDNHLDEPGAATIAAALAAAPHRLAFLNLRYTDLGSPGALRLLEGAQRAATPTRFLLGGGIAKRVKKELTALAAEIPASVFDVAPDVRAIRSVYRTAPPA
ncbi:Leucine-rich repeat, ribonuclease inhibitor subtype [Catenulispora acidiphila DSM 44928]|uniref:Leucine-rich repeat, ribonuclease inhibitor subtype n=1 Tax=Catenulispora acidiphila (strain DSM 44928 / JCM 14897 / NBRC 102108 / NRRL B-24433 / ID139908) TaxID=479433 RepID=C7QBA7_CATAD|nr:ribonuclease inhibitor [Catenulispora acidiphila]ACU76398.1 Leucine-rich repeat, ribonuclease inhibitor subtype [Catenulispora acidiphila DSM 44928]